MSNPLNNARCPRAGPLQVGSYRCCRNAEMSYESRGGVVAVQTCLLGINARCLFFCLLFLFRSDWLFGRLTVGNIKSRRVYIPICPHLSRVLSVGRCCGIFRMCNIMTNIWWVGVSDFCPLLPLSIYQSLDRRRVVDARRMWHGST